MGKIENVQMLMIWTNFALILLLCIPIITSLTCGFLFSVKRCIEGTSFSLQHQHLSHFSLGANNPSRINTFRHYAGKTGDKVRVRLLSDVKDVGKKGEIVLVSPSLFNNMLLVQKTAEKISDSELEKINADKARKYQAELSLANSFINLITKDNTISLTRKAGANGQLFGSIAFKQIVDELKSKFVGFEALWDWKGNGVIEIVDESGAKVSDIRKIGKYKLVLRVHPDIINHSTNLVVSAEK